MDKMKIIKNNDRNVIIIITTSSLEKEFKMYLVSYLSNVALEYDLVSTAYKVDSQKIIVFNFMGDERKIENFLKTIEGL